MNKNLIEQLAKVYNTLLSVSTSGEDTITMAQCLLALREIILSTKQESCE